MKQSKIILAIATILVLSSQFAMADGGDLGSGTSDCNQKAVGNVEGIVLEAAIEECEHPKAQLFLPLDRKDKSIKNSLN